MTIATRENVAELYIAFFDRAPDTDGLNYWVSQSGLSLEQIAQSFFDQPETQEKYGDVDFETLINTIYQNVLGRVAEAAGLEYWVGELESGSFTKDQAILAIINGALGSDAELLENKTEVGLYWADNNQDGSPDEFQIIDEVNADPTSVEECKQWIDGELPVAPSQYFSLNDDDIKYDLTGSAGNDVFAIEAFKAVSKIHGGDGDDTLDFSEMSDPVEVNLLTGQVKVDGAVAMNVSWVESIRGTDGDDIITGNANANTIVLNGGADQVNAYIGDDKIYALDMQNVVDSAATVIGINGGSGTDTLVIWDTDIDLTDAAVVGGISDIEVLEVGYAEEGVPSAATVLVDEDGFPAGFKKIVTTESYDKKGKEMADTVRSVDGDADGVANLDLSGMELVNFERVEADGDITVTTKSLAAVDEVVGNILGVGSNLILKGKDGDVFDLTRPKFTGVDTVQLSPAGIAATIVANQSLLETIEFLETIDLGTGVGDKAFAKATLQLAGLGIDMTGAQLPLNGFKEIKFGADTQALVLASEQILDDMGTPDDTTDDEGLAAAGTVITGSEYNADTLSIKGPGVLDLDLSALEINAIETLDFEEISTVKLTNEVLTDVNNISGDSDGNPQTSLLDATDHTVDKGGLDLSGIYLRDIYALNGVATDGTEDQGIFTIDTHTNFSSVKVLGGVNAAGDQVEEVIVNLGEAGTYDFSGVAEYVNDAGTPDDTTDDVTTEVTIKGSAGNDVVKGSATSGMTYDLGAGDDQVIGGAGNETFIGGKGADSMTGGKGNDTFKFKVGDTGTTEATVDCINDYTIATVKEVDGADALVGDHLTFTWTAPAAFADAAGTDLTETFADGALNDTAGNANVQFDDVGNMFSDESSLLDAALAALNNHFDDLDVAGQAALIGADPAYTSFAMQFQYGGAEYLVVDAYAKATDISPAADPGTVYSYTAGADFIVKLAGVTGSLSEDDITVTGVEMAAA